MAYLYRLIVCLLVLACGGAHAALPRTAEYQFPATGYNVVGPWLTDKQAACNSRLSDFTMYGVTVAILEVSVCSLRYSSGTVFGAYGLVSRTVCPPNSTGGATCTCTAPYVEAGSVCAMPVDPNEAHCTSIVGSAVKTSWTSTAPSLSTRTVCVTNAGFSCNATIEPDFCGSSDGVTSVCYGSGVSAAGVCAPSPTPETPVAPTAPVSELPSPPPPGTCPGQVNGVTVNLPCNNSVSKAVKTETTNNGAGTSTTKSESRSTSCTAAGSCSTTVTTVTSVNGGAPVTSTKTVAETKGEFCAGNPAAKECGDGEGSSFGGSCDSGFVCEGDAVQCAHAKETHLQNCKINKDTPERQLYESSKGDTADFDNDQTVNVSPSSFSQAPILGAASCISDKSITVMGETVSLPFSRVCQYLAMLGNVLMAVGFLLSGRIIMRG